MLFDPTKAIRIVSGKVEQIDLTRHLCLEQALHEGNFIIIGERISEEFFEFDDTDVRAQTALLKTSFVFGTQFSAARVLSMVHGQQPASLRELFAYERAQSIRGEKVNVATILTDRVGTKWVVLIVQDFIGQGKAIQALPFDTPFGEKGKTFLFRANSCEKPPVDTKDLFEGRPYRRLM